MKDDVYFIEYRVSFPVNSSYDDFSNWLQLQTRSGWPWVKRWPTEKGYLVFRGTEEKRKNYGISFIVNGYYESAGGKIEVMDIALMQFDAIVDTKRNIEEITARCAPPPVARSFIELLTRISERYTEAQPAISEYLENNFGTKPESPDDCKPIEEFPFPGGIDYLETFLAEFRIDLPEKWKDWKFEDYYKETHPNKKHPKGVAGIAIVKPSIHADCRAFITAFQRPNGETRLKFYNGYIPFSGKSFSKIDEFVDFVRVFKKRADEWALPVDTAEGKTSKKSKRGPRKYSKSEKISAREEWDQLDRDENPTTLEEWLEYRFGASAKGMLNVSPSTFYGWPKS